MEQGYTHPRGALSVRRITRTRAPLAWKIRNALRRSWIKGWIATHLIAPFANIWGVATLIARLDAVLIRANGERIYYDALSFRVITDAGVAYLVDDWDDSTTDITNLHFHGCGTGTTAEAAGDTALVTESTTALNPDSTRATGTESQPAANQLRTIGTLTFDASAAVTEHGIFSQAATGGGTLWDRSVFSAINVVSGDSIQFTYTCTVSSGG
jgi:hypothetical protein